MKAKILNFLLLLTSGLAYLEWGGEQSTFLFEAELEIIKKAFTAPQEILHPFVIIPFAGQIILLVTLFQKSPSKILSLLAILFLFLLYAVILFIGAWNLNYKILFFATPFILFSIIRLLQIKSEWRKK